MKIWDPINKRLVTSNHVKVEENSKGADWLKELAREGMPQITRPAQISDISNTSDSIDDSILVGDTIIVDVGQHYNDNDHQIQPLRIQLGSIVDERSPSIEVEDVVSEDSAHDEIVENDENQEIEENRRDSDQEEAIQDEVVA